MHRFLHHLKEIGREARGFPFFLLVRRLERLLPVGCLYSALFPVFYLRALVDTLFTRPFPAGPLPPFFRTPEPLVTRIRLRTDGYLNRVLLHFPDRLGRPEWRERCRIEGLDRLEIALQNNRPVVLAFSHYGPYQLLHLWLRSFGLPAAMLASGLAERSRLKRRQDAQWLRPELPVALFPSRLKDVTAFLRAGNFLLIAIDASRGKLIRVPFSPGWSFQMATGAIRLAAGHGAELIPCSITTEGRWRYCIRLGSPLDEVSGLAPDDLEKTGHRLVEAMKRDFEARPEQCSPFIIRSLFRDSS